jgi:DNA-directed RNA polymerase I and III subunit RPAC1
MAIETVYVWNNTSIMQDEVLCHRIGLIPLKIDPRKMKVAADPRKPHENDTIIFDLRVRCDRRPDARPDETDPKKRYFDSDVYSGMLEWVPQGDQANKFKHDPPRPVNDDILLVKLRAGQVCR